MTATPVRMDGLFDGEPLPFDGVCPVCSGNFDVTRLREPVRVCGCGAGRRAMELAAAFLQEWAHGIHATVRALAADATIPHPRVLDLSLDPVLPQAITLADRLTRGNPFGPEAALRLPQPVDPVDLAALPAADASVDVVFLRDVLFWVPELTALVHEVGRVLAPGGHAVFQETFAWQFPDETVEAGGGAALPLRAGGGTRMPERRIIGADFLDLLATVGLRAYGYRPGLSVDPLYRNLLIVAVRDGAPVSKA